MNATSYTSSVALQGCNHNERAEMPNPGPLALAGVSVSGQVAAVAGKASVAQGNPDLPGLAPLPPCPFGKNPSPSPSVSLPARQLERAGTVPTCLASSETDAFAAWVDIVGVGDCGEVELASPDPLELSEEPEAVCGALQLETTGLSRQPRKSELVDQELWKRATTFKFSVAAKLREAGMTEDADSLEDCHSRRVFAQCVGCSSVRVFRNRCDQFFCPECQPKLARKRMEGVKWWAERISQPKHVVLTVRNIPDLSKGHLLEFKKWITRLRHRKFFKNVRGGFYSLEITNENNGWHLHCHMLLDAPFLDARVLSTEWASVNSGAGYIVKVMAVRNDSYLREVTKYAVKGSEIAAWKASDISTFIHAFRGVKTFGVFGSLYGKRTEFRDWILSLRDAKPACPCGCDKLRFYDESEWLALSLVPNSCRSSIPPPPDPQEEFGAVMAATRSFYHR